MCVHAVPISSLSKNCLLTFLTASRFQITDNFGESKEFLRSHVQEVSNILNEFDLSLNLDLSIFKNSSSGLLGF